MNKIDWRNPRIICWFSCGAASAVAAKLTIENMENYPIQVICCDTRVNEHPDNYRFAEEVERWIGQPIIFMRNEDYETVDDVFNRHRYMSGIAGARCTTELKKEVRLKYAQPDDLHVFGFTVDEGKRISEFTERNPDLRLLWTLQELGITKEQCFMYLNAASIRIPEMYKLGFNNNNCLGCVKAGSPWYWDKTRQLFPEVFARRCEQSRRLGVRLVKLYGRRIFLDELPPGPFPKRGAIEENVSCGPECGQSGEQQ
jgi:hypothetical protein